MQRAILTAVVLGLATGGAPLAQSGNTAPAPDQAGQREALQQALSLRESRYQIGQMERVLEGAVEHGATVIRDRLQVLMPSDMLLTENARVRGFRLEGYGVFFDVEVPSLEGTLPWSFRTLDQNELGIDNALRTIRSFIEAAAANDLNVQQAMKRIELQVAPLTAAADPAPVAASTSGQPAPDDPSAQPSTQPAEPPRPAPPADASDPILSNPNEAYRAQIRDALVDAMLEHSRGLNVGPAETLTVAARGASDRPRLTVDTDLRTVVISVRGGDLADFLGGRISRDEARRRVLVRVF
jgi:hypothetical protein